MPIPPSIARILIRTGLIKKIPAVVRLVGDGIDYLRYLNDRLLLSPNTELKQVKRLFEHLDPDVIDLSLGVAAPDDVHLHPRIQARIAQLFQGVGQSADVSSLLQSRDYVPATGLPIFRTAVAEKLKRDNNIVADPDKNIMACNGVSQAIGLVLDTFVNPGESVVLFDPSFFIYRMACENRGIRTRFVASQQEDGWMQVNDAQLARAIRGARMIFVNSPNNPTGGVFAQEQLEKIVWLCNKHDVLIFSDEVYEAYHYAARSPSIGSLPGALNRTITAQSISKSFAMPTQRVGFLAAHEHLISPMTVSAIATAPFVNQLGQQIAAELYRDPESCSVDLNRFRIRRDRLLSVLRRHQVQVDTPLGGFFCWANAQDLLDVTNLQVPNRSRESNSKKSPAITVHERLLERQLCVLPGENCGPSGKRFVRLSFAIPELQFNQALSQLEQFLTSTAIQPNRRHAA